MNKQPLLASLNNAFRGGSLYSRLVLTILAICLASCMHLPKTAPITTHITIQTLPSHWQINGKLALKMPRRIQSNELQTHVLRFNWQQQKNDFDLQLMGPLNIGLMSVIKRQQLTTLIIGDQRIESDNAEQLLSEQTNLPLPLNSLRFWLTGQASPDWPVKYFNNETEKTGFIQQGWHVEYPKVMSDQQYSLPKKVIARHGQMKLSIVIYQWQFSGDSEQPQ